MVPRSFSAVLLITMVLTLSSTSQASRPRQMQALQRLEAKKMQLEKALEGNDAARKCRRDRRRAINLASGALKQASRCRSRAGDRVEFNKLVALCRTKGSVFKAGAAATKKCNALPHHQKDACFTEFVLPLKKKIVVIGRACRMVNEKRPSRCRSIFELKRSLAAANAIQCPPVRDMTKTQARLDLIIMRIRKIQQLLGVNPSNAPTHMVY